MNGMRVTVIGGGLAGITAALDCARGGAAVTLLEARGRLGGAVYSFERHGVAADNGQHVFLRCCTAYRGLLKDLEATGSVELQPRLRIAVLAPGAEPAWLYRSSLPAPFHLAGALLRYQPLSIRQRLSAARAMRRLDRIDPDSAVTDKRSFGEWLDQQGQDERTREALWELIVRPTLNLRAQNASLAQVAQVFQTGLLHDPAAGDIGIARVPLSEIHDLAARRALTRAGVDVRLRHGAAAIRQAGEQLSVQISGAPALTADAVVVAVPPARAARLLPEQAGVDAAIAAGLGSSPIVNLHVVYDRRVLDMAFAAGIGSPVQWVFDRTRSAGPGSGPGSGSGQYLVVSLSAADAELEATVDELRDRYLAALAELLPRAREATVETFFVTREHAATFRAAPGARAWRPPARTGVPGLVLAGAWTDTGWPATMEGAVRSGHEAARQALDAAAAAAGARHARAAESPVGQLAGSGA
jgi:squalene-associated FAD-dependent desaturase